MVPESGATPGLVVLGTELDAEGSNYTINITITRATAQSVPLGQWVNNTLPNNRALFTFAMPIGMSYGSVKISMLGASSYEIDQGETMLKQTVCDNCTYYGVLNQTADPFVLNVYHNDPLSVRVDSGKQENIVYFDINRSGCSV